MKGQPAEKAPTGGLLFVFPTVIYTWLALEIPPLQDGLFLTHQAEGGGDDDDTRQGKVGGAASLSIGADQQ